MKVLAIASFPKEAAATRFRLSQFVEPLARLGIEVDLKPFFSSEQFAGLYRQGGTAGKVVGIAGGIARRLGELASSSKYDLLFVQREAMPIGPAIFERLFRSLGRMQMVLDLDDATYVRYVSPTYGRLGSSLKFFGKTDSLIDSSIAVTCGNRFIADHVLERGRRAVVIPTVVDTDLFRPVERTNEIPVIGWIGTHSTYQFLETLLPTLEKLALKHKFLLRVVGSGREAPTSGRLDMEFSDWTLDREISDFQSIDIGLYPLGTQGSLDPAWLAGKSGFKAIQYLAVGVPFVMSPVGVCAEIGEEGITHFNARSDEDWYNELDKLLSDRSLRERMGLAARAHSVAVYGLNKHADLLAQTLRSADESR